MAGESGVNDRSILISLAANFPSQTAAWKFEREYRRFPLKVREGETSLAGVCEALIVECRVPKERAERLIMGYFNRESELKVSYIFFDGTSALDTLESLGIPELDCGETAYGRMAIMNPLAKFRLTLRETAKIFRGKRHLQETISGITDPLPPEDCLDRLVGIYARRAAEYKTG